MLSSKTLSAAKLFKAEKYAEALVIYQQLCDEIGREYFSANLKICRSRLMSTEYGSSTKKRRKHGVRVACVMDEFTFGSYKEECELMQLTPSNWHYELNEFKPEFVFIESAWRGKDDLWGSKVGHNSDELKGILQWCKENDVPSIFWNKEDPVHYSTFLTSASQFDFVFTTDIDCVPRYKKALGHDRVYFLPFACQPSIHNPIELYERKDAFCFAGAYYAKYPERTKDLESFIAELPGFRDLEIFDRNFGKDDSNYKFPDQYSPYIVGTLAFDEIDRAYKGYKYAINLNSIKQSQSMFARRVYELLASNTYTISNFSRGLRLMFGDLVLSTDNGVEVCRRLEELSEKKYFLDKVRLIGLRKILSEHTYQDRLDYILSKIFCYEIEDSLPKIIIVSEVKDVEELNSLVNVLSNQSYKNFQVYVFDKSADGLKADHLRGEFVFLNKSSQDYSLDMIGEVGEYIGYISPSDYYGKNYLKDLVLTTKYIDIDVIQKARLFSCDGEQILEETTESYRVSNGIVWNRSLVKKNIVSKLSIKEFLGKIEEKYSFHNKVFVIDGFNYCENGSNLNESQRVIVDDVLINEGVSLKSLQLEAEKSIPLEESSEAINYLAPNRLAEIFSRTRSRNVDLDIVDGFKLVSSLPDGKHDYLLASEDMPLTDLILDSELKLHLDVEPGLNLQIVAFFLDAAKQRLAHAMAPAGRNLTASIPDDAMYIKLGFRVYGSGSSTVRKLVVGHQEQSVNAVFTAGKTLLLTNNYPSYKQLYRNGFVHSRVRMYKNAGKHVDVFRFRPESPLSFDEFNDIDVINGDSAVLDKVLSQGDYETVLVHFMDRNMWSILEKYIDTTNVVVWVHGADIQPWYRRNFDPMPGVELAKLKQRSDDRIEFWRSVLNSIPKRLKLIFVSKSFAEDVFEDLGFRLSAENYEIIHNPIDTDLFEYNVKGSEYRKKILSIRPYASRLYANDLTVEVIRKLSKEPFFGELEFKIVGDGKLFDEVTEPLKSFPNVSVEKRFLTQIEIAALHKEYGVFLCPSRTDTQGVSRDEAMSSGLVPVTNASGAIPEFLDERQGILAAAEDVDAMVRGIKSLYENPQDFLSMSFAASERVRKQSGKEIIMPKEMSLF